MLLWSFLKQLFKYTFKYYNLSGTLQKQFKMRFALIFGFLTGAFALKCQKGSVPDSKNICIRPKFIEGCFTYATQQTCQTCNYNYKLEDTGLCTFDPKSPQPCCLQPDDKKCRKCNRGMSLVNGSCIQTQSLGCLQKSVTGQCNNCASDFMLEGTTCRQGVRYCQKYLQTDRLSCQKCIPSYSLIGNLCLKNKILGCKVEEKGSCTTCFDPFHPKDGGCEIKHCRQYNDFGCESCQCGYFITKKMTCEKVQQGCVRYQRGICTDCFPPFTLLGTVCTIDGCKTLEGNKCTKCNQSYKMENDKCVLPNCLKGRNGKCEVCKQGYNFNGGECLPSSAKRAFMAN